MRIILEGPDSCGKSTLASKIIDKYGFNYIHFPSNDLDAHMLALKNDNTVFDRFHIGELVYPEIYGREPKLDFDDAKKIMKRIVDNNDLFIIFYSSDVSILKERLIARKEYDYLEEIEQQNVLFAKYAWIFNSYEYSNYYVIDIAENDAYDKLDAWIDEHTNKTTINIAYQNVCKDLLYKSKDVISDNTTRGSYKELTNYSFTIDDISNDVVSLKTRGVSYSYLAGELVWYLKSRNDLNFISKFSKFWSKISDDGVTCNSAYGYILSKKYGFDQIEKIIELLKSDKETRRAVLNINCPNINVIYTKDELCTIALVFMIRDNKLNCTGIMRSNDVSFGLTYDLTYFLTIQKYIADSVGVEYGSYTHFTTSMHVYEKDLELVSSIAEGSLESFDEVFDVSRLISDIDYFNGYIDSDDFSRKDFLVKLKEKGVIHEYR